jgi:hypothetical protein
MDCLGKKEWILIYIGLAAVIIIALVLLGFLIVCIVWPQVFHGTGAGQDARCYIPEKPVMSLPTTAFHSDVFAIMALVSTKGDPERTSCMTRSRLR